MTTPPIACTLMPGDFKARLAWVAELNRDSLLSFERRGRTLTLHFAKHAGERVHELVQRERECCAFLGFEIAETADDWCVRVTAPEAAEVLLDEFIK
jgi:hypothetical protein